MSAENGQNLNQNQNKIQGKTEKKHILIVEDDSVISKVESDYLCASGFLCETAPDGDTALKKFLSAKYDLVLLDLMLPGTDGLTLCRRFREKSDIPILIISARLDDSDKIRGLGYGADDYIEKPFSPAVLLARIKAHLAVRERISRAAKSQDEEIHAGKITVNTVSRRVYVSGKETILKNKEYELLLFLINHRDMVFDRETLYEEVWGLETMGDNATVAVHINRIREKIESDPSAPEYIETVWGAGYRFCVPEE